MFVTHSNMVGIFIVPNFIIIIYKINFVRHREYVHDHCGNQSANMFKGVVDTCYETRTKHSNALGGVEYICFLNLIANGIDIYTHAHTHARLPVGF